MIHYTRDLYAGALVCGVLGLGGTFACNVGATGVTITADYFQDVQRRDPARCIVEARRLARSGHEVDAALMLLETLDAEFERTEDVRSSAVWAMTRELVTLTEQSKDALVLVTAFRNAGAPGRDFCLRRVRRWLIFNRVLQDPEATADWYREVADLPGFLAIKPAIHQEVFRDLFGARRFPEAGRFLDEPVQRMSHRHELGARAAGDNVQIAHAGHQLDAQYYACLLAAHRKEEAAAVLTLIRKGDSAGLARLQVVRVALECDVLNEDHRELLEEASGLGAVDDELTRAMDAHLLDAAEGDGR
jgi:hypothetical protein